MPYQDDFEGRPTSSRITLDYMYLTKLPGTLILVQLVCCLMGFVLALNGTVSWKMRNGHTFFTLVVFLSMLSCVCWIVFHVFKLQELFKKNINWNIMGLVHNGLNAFLLMSASSAMIEISFSRAHKAAGVFGFLGFSAFLAALVWEGINWHSKRESLPGYCSATVVPGRERDKTPESEQSAGVAEEAEEEGISFVGIKQRPVSSFLEQQHGTSGLEMSTPMLIVPANESKETNDSRSSTASSIHCEWQVASSDQT